MLIVVWHVGINSQWNAVRSNLQRGCVRLRLQVNLRLSFSNVSWGGLIFHNWGTAAVYSEHASLCCFSKLEKLLSPLVQSSLLIWYIAVFPHTVWTARRHPVQVFSGEDGCSERWCQIDDRCERRSDDVCLVDQLLPLTGTKHCAASLQLMSIFIVCI